MVAPPVDILCTRNEPGRSIREDPIDNAVMALQPHGTHDDEHVWIHAPLSHNLTSALSRSENNVRPVCQRCELRHLHVDDAAASLLKQLSVECGAIR
jgi:hypothetical protein